MKPELNDQVEIVLGFPPPLHLQSGDRGTVIRIPQEGLYEVEFLVEMNGNLVRSIIPQNQLYVVKKSAIGSCGRVLPTLPHGREIPLEKQISQVMDGLSEKDHKELLGWARFLKARSTQEKSKKNQPGRAVRGENLRYKDFFIVGTSFVCNEILRHHQLGLQETFGGRLIEPVHFTIQRFRFFEEDRLQAFRTDLKQNLSGIKSFPVRAQNIVTLYSEYRRARVLKWHITLTSELQNVADLVEKLLNLHEGKSMLPPRWISDLITALEDIQDMGFQMNLQLIPVPDPLFQVEQLILAQFTNQEDFKILEEFPL